MLIRKLTYTKRLLFLLFISLLLAVQSFLLKNWTPEFFIQCIFFDLFMLMGIYGFKGFDADTAKSINASIIAFAVGALFGGLFSAILAVLIFNTSKLPREIFIISYLLTVAIFPFICRIAIKSAFKVTPKKRYLVIGREEEIGSLINEIIEASMGKIEIYRYMNPSAIALTEAIAIPRKFESILIGDLALAKEVTEVLDQAMADGISIEYLPDIVEKYTHRIPVELVKKFQGYYEVIFASTKFSPKVRIFDIAFSLIILTILSPFFLIAILAILIKDGRPIFYTQPRHGVNGKVFKIYKLRTMDDVPGSDPVNTKSGHFLRMTRMNELPQLWNIIKGDMSLVGPRPDITSSRNFCLNEIPFYNFRTKILPGVTGHAQVCYRYVDKLEYETFARRLSYDLFYIKNLNVILYFTTMLRTVETMLFKRGAK